MVIGGLLGAVASGMIVHGLVQNCRVWDFTLDPEVWISALLGVVVGGLLSWLMAWVYARKAEKDAHALLKTIEALPGGGEIGPQVLGLIVSVLTKNPTLASATAAGLAGLIHKLTGQPLGPGGAKA